MKRHLLAVAVTCFMATSAQADEAALLKRIEVLENRVDELDAAIKMMAPGALARSLAGTPAQAPSPTVDGKTDLASLQAPDLPVKIDKVKSAGKDIMGQPGIALQITMMNNTSKDMDIITASIVIEDVAGNRLLNVKWQNNKGISAGKSATMSGSFSGTLTNNGVETALATDPALLRARAEIFKVAYKGGEVVTYKDCGFNCD